MLTHANGSIDSQSTFVTSGIEVSRFTWHDVEKSLLLPGDVPTIALLNPEPTGLPSSLQRSFIPETTPVRPLIWQGKQAGVRYSDESADYILLTGVGPTDITASRADQTTSTFENIEAILVQEGFTFAHVVRTWLYMERILEWYDDFNRARDAFFESRKVFGGFVPASTGIGSANATGSAIISAAIAMRPKAVNGATRAVVDSPLQCSALDYRSSFSRAAEIVTPTETTLFISGTASIEPGGLTAHLDDPVKQIDLTMEVVHEILKTRDMTWKNTTRAIAYIKRPEYRPIWQNWLKANGLPADFAQEIIADVCRDDLLFELELDAVKKA